MDRGVPKKNGIYLFVMVITIGFLINFGTYLNKAYASDYTSVDSALASLGITPQMDYSNYQYRVVFKRTDYAQTIVLYSHEPIGTFTDTGGTVNGSLGIWLHLGSSGCYADFYKTDTKLFTGTSTDISKGCGIELASAQNPHTFVSSEVHPNGLLLYSSRDLMVNNTCYYTGTNEEYDPKFSYEYSSQIPNVANMNLNQHYITKLGVIYIGLNKLKYDVTWDNPNDETLAMEVKVVGKYNSYTRSYKQQTYEIPMYRDTQTYLLPSDMKYMFNINTLAKEFTEKAFSDVDVQIKNREDYVTPSTLYYRYVRKDDNAYKVYYGNWTRLTISVLGATGVTDAKFDTVKQTETVDPTTGETTLTDTVVDGTTTKYVNPINGEEVSESETFNSAAEGVGVTIDSVSTAFKSVGDWAGEIPAVVGKLFSFLPSEIIVLMSTAIVTVIALRIIGR